jgi:acyl dehydratase
MNARVAEGPYFDELTVGDTFLDAPPLTLTEGGAAAHQAVVGDRLRLFLDHTAGRAVTGTGPLAPPAYVWNVAIGQSTIVTHHVRANLFYRGLAFHRFPELGDTLTTDTTVVGLKENSARPDRPRTGLTALHIVTRDQESRTVLDFHRCAMLPLRDPHALTGRADDLSALGTAVTDFASAVAHWDLDPLRLRGAAVPLVPGSQVEVLGGDLVSSAPELARLTLNVARVHHDASAADGRRLVYGGHTIALALAQVTRALPQLVTVVGWEACDHVGPVHEGDTLRSRLEVTSLRARAEGGQFADVRCTVTADADPTPRDVLDWRFTALTL